MKDIYHSRLLIVLALATSMLLLLVAWTETNITYQVIFVLFGFAYLFFSIRALRIPALKMDENSIYYRQFFSFKYMRIERVHLFSFKKVGNSRLCLYDSKQDLILKMGFFNRDDLSKILETLQLRNASRNRFKEQ